MKHYFPDHIINKNGRVNIVLVGAGGTGSQVLSDLARLHFALQALGHPGFDVTVFDDGPVRTANVGRQLFSPSDIGRNKAEVLVSRINRFFGLDWKAVQHNAGKAPLPQSDILITAVDTARARKEIFRSARRKVRYWLDTGNTAHTGQTVLGTLMPVPQPKKAKDVMDILPTVFDLYRDMEKQDTTAKQGPSCSVAQALERQDLLINKMVATCAMQLLWSAFRHGYVREHGAFVNLKPINVRSLPVDPETWKRMGWKPKEAKDN